MIDTLVFNSLSDIDYLKSNLAKFNNAPAIFYAEAPHDHDSHWGDKQYPRVDYYIDWTANAERKTAGVLMVNVWCQTGKAIIPDDFINPITEKMTNRFYKDDDGHYCTVWMQNDPFESAGEEPAIVGITISFEIMAFPEQATFTPDPVIGMQNFIKDKFPNSIILLGDDTTGDTFTPDDLELPIAYVRTDNQSSVLRDTYAVKWLQVSIYIHVFTQNVKTRNDLLREIVNAVVVSGECLLDDNSPLFFQQVKMDLAADPLRFGQITVNGRFGILNDQEPGVPLTKINFIY